MSSIHSLDIDDRASYRTTLLHCLRHNGLLDQSGIPGHSMLLQDLYRLIASEWVAVHMYLERDLSTIEWRLEVEKAARLEILELFLDQLLVFRRRTLMYSRLIEEQMRTISTGDPKSWDGGRPSIDHAKQMLISDFAHVQRLFNPNITRINQVISIIMPLISIRDGKVSTAQNHRLGFLTAIATVLLPFNVVSTILAIPSPYGPRGENFWVFWTASGVGSIMGLASFLLYSWVFNSRTKDGMGKAKKSGSLRLVTGFER
jgi:Mg2+ and Co2+ transporter CorA